MHQRNLTETNNEEPDHRLLFTGNTSGLFNAVTIVTMYLNIGDFQKGENGHHSPGLYRRWMKAFWLLQNPVIAFFDNEDDLKYFEKRRRHLGADRTRCILVKRSELWAFSLLEKIRKIFSRPDYPKHHPNTVVPEYSCAMHAKYECMLRAIEENIFHTRYFAWLDIGLFRSLVASNSLSFFEMWLPPNFNVSTVAYTEVYHRILSSQPEYIVASNAVWVSGAFFIGEASVMVKLSKQYMRATETLIEKYDLMSTDQQVLYIMANWGNLTVNIQTYHNPNLEQSDWFYLGYLCKDQGYKRSHGLI